MIKTEECGVLFKEETMLLIKEEGFGLVQLISCGARRFTHMVQFFFLPKVSR